MREPASGTIAGWRNTNSTIHAGTQIVINPPAFNQLQLAGGLVRYAGCTRSVLALDSVFFMEPSMLPSAETHIILIDDKLRRNLHRHALRLRADPQERLMPTQLTTLVSQLRFLRSKSAAVVTEVPISAKPKQRLNKLQGEQLRHVHGLIHRSIFHEPSSGIDPIDRNLEC